MDYNYQCEAAKAELQKMLNDLNSRAHQRGNLSYLIKRAMFSIECVQKYVNNFGSEEVPIAHVGYTKEQMGYDK